MDILQRLGNAGVVPVVVIEDAKDAVPTAKAMLSGGIDVMEITFRTAAAADSIKAVADSCPDMLVGAGTVITLDQCKQAVACGAKFIVSPGFDEEVVRWCVDNGVAVTPGCVTPTEITAAMKLGLKVVKFFPAEQNGGVAKLKAVAGPYTTLRWMPTGGVNTKNMMDYLSFDKIIACGGTWMVKKDLIEGEKWDEITRICQEAVKTMMGFTLAHVGINCANADEAAQTAKTLCALFGLEYKAGNSSDFAGSIVECNKAPGRGANGHIAIGTYNVDRAVYHLGLQGVRFDQASRKTDAKGNTKAIYLQDEVGGFAIHLVKR